MQYLNALHADHVVLECAHRPLEEIEVFKDLKPEIGFGLGVIDIKATEVESADAVARAIERAESTLGAGRVKLHPSRLRLLDAQAPDRRRQDPRPRAGARPVRRASDFLNGSSGPAAIAFVTLGASEAGRGLRSGNA